MKRKYYLRGLGFGILITTFVFIMVGPSELSNEEIIQRAEQLGYVKVEEENKTTINLEELLKEIQDLILCLMCSNNKVFLTAKDITRKNGTIKKFWLFFFFLFVLSSYTSKKYTL